MSTTEDRGEDSVIDAHRQALCWAHSRSLGSRGVIAFADFTKGPPGGRVLAMEVGSS